MASETSKAQGIAAANPGATGDAGRKTAAKGKPAKAKVARVAAAEKATPGGGKRRAADGLVMMAMALVALALCFGLVVQAGVGLWLAVTVSAAFYMGLLTLHALARRHEQLDELRGEVERLKRDVARFGGEPAAGPPRAESVHGGSVVVATVPAPGAYDPAVAEAMPRQSEPTGMPTFGRPAPIAAAPQRPAPHAGAEDIAPPRSAAAAVPEVVRAPQSAGKRPPPRTAEAPLAGSVLPAADDMARKEPGPFGGVNRVPRNPNSVSEGRAGGDVAALSGEPMPVAPPSIASEGETAFNYRPGDEASRAPVSPREADVEMIQGLIKKLADEVNAADAAKLAPGRGNDSGQIAIDESIAALRDTAGSMRRGRSDAFTGDVRHASERGRDAPVTARAPIPQEAAEVGRPLADDEDLDVEALLRRAEPIARMTSMPPPLPAAAVHSKRTADVATQRADVEDRASFDEDTARELAEIEASRHGSAMETAAAESMRNDAISSQEMTAEISGWDGAASSDDTDVAQKAAAERRLEGVADAIGAGRIDVFLEPILDLEKQQPRHYEVSVRLRTGDGRELVIDHDAEACFASGALPLLDSVCLRRTASVARRLEERNKPGSVFATFNGQSLASDEFLTEFADAYDAQESLAGQLVLTFSQADVRRFRSPHWTMLQEMRDLGFSFALRAMTDLDMDFEQLASSGFKFVKLDAVVFLEGMPAPGAMLPAADICKHLAGEGMTLIVEAIDDDQRRARVFGFGVLFGQGRLFGGPRLMKAAAVAGEKSAAA